MLNDRKSINGYIVFYPAKFLIYYDLIGLIDIQKSSTLPCFTILDAPNVFSQLIT